jgi:serine/threonine protein kinase
MHKNGFFHRDIKPENMLVKGNCSGRGVCESHSLWALIQTELFLSKQGMSSSSLISGWPGRLGQNLRSRNTCPLDGIGEWVSLLLSSLHIIAFSSFHSRLFVEPSMRVINSPSPYMHYGGPQCIQCTRSSPARDKLQLADRSVGLWGDPSRTIHSATLIPWIFRGRRNI